MEGEAKKILIKFNHTEDCEELKGKRSLKAFQFHDFFPCPETIFLIIRSSLRSVSLLILN